jgi:hypothetical protein
MAKEAIGVAFRKQLHLRPSRQVSCANPSGFYKNVQNQVNPNLALPRLKSAKRLQKEL